MNGLLSLLIFLPVVGTLAVLPRAAREDGCHPLGRDALHGRRVPPLAAALDAHGIPDLGRLLLPRDARLDSLARREVRARRRRDRGAPDPPHDAPLLHLGLLVVHGDHEAREGVLRVPPPPRDGDGRRLLRARLLPVLRVLGGHARPDVLPDRGLGRAAQALRRDQVLPVHARGLGRHAARDHRPLLLQHVGLPVVEGPRQRAVVRHRPLPGDRVPDSAGPPDLALLGVLHRLRDQGPDVPVPHVAAGRARRGADGRLRDPRGRPPQDGDVRVPPLLAADLPGGLANAPGSSSRSSCSRSSASSTARWSRWSRRT